MQHELVDVAGERDPAHGIELGLQLAHVAAEPHRSGPRRDLLEPRPRPVDLLEPLGVTVNELSMTPERVVAAIAAARTSIADDA